MDIFIQNLINQKKRIVIGFGSVFTGTVLLLGYFRSGPDALSYAKAESAFSEWEASPENDQLYAAMQHAIGTVPSLKKKYEGAIAQKLLNTDKINEALVMAQRSLQRVKGEIPFHSAYAETSLLIQQGNCQKALENAVALKEQMGNVSELKAGALLYAYNLLRIACLQQELKNRPGEKASWEELESFLGKNRDLSNVFMGSFSQKSATLSQYIAERKQSL